MQVISRAKKIAWIMVLGRSVTAIEEGQKGDIEKLPDAEINKLFAELQERSSVAEALQA